MLSPMLLRGASLVVWAAAAGSAAFWGLKVFASPRPLPDGAAVPPPVAVAAAGALPRVLGVTPVVVAAEDEPVMDDGRFTLLGVVAPKTGARGGVALIAVNGEPAKPFRVGQPVLEGTVLLAVAARQAQLGPRGGDAEITLTLPEPGDAGGAAPPPPQRAGAVPGRPTGMPPGQVLPMRAPLQPASAPMQQADDGGGGDEEEE